MTSNRPETSEPRHSSQPGGTAETQAPSSPEATIYEPHASDLVTPTHRARDTTKLHIPPSFLQSEAVDSSLLLGHGASFTVTRQALPPGPPVLKQRFDMGGWSLEKVTKAPERPKYVVYKSARVVFKANGFPVTAEDRRALQSVLTEFHALLHPQLLKHPNIIDFLGLAWGSNHAEPLHRLPVLVVEYGDRGTLADVQLQGPALPNSLKLDICLGIARGLEVLHYHGIVHGDVKPENIIMCSHKDKILVPKLADFGFAIIEDAESSNGAMIGGTRTWRAPESYSLVPISQLRFTDVYSFGLLAWSIAIDGQDPFNLVLPRLRESERGEEIDRLKMTNKVLALSRLENWFLGWQTRHQQASTTLSMLPATVSRITGPDGEPTRTTFLVEPSNEEVLPEKEQQTNEAIASLFSTAVSQVYFKDLDSLFSHTLNKDPTQRDLSAVIDLLENQDISPSSTIATSSVVDTAVTPVIATQSGGVRAGTGIKRNDADTSRSNFSDQIENTPQDASHSRHNNPTRQGREVSRFKSPASKISWPELGFKQRRYSWQMTRDLEPSVQSFVVKTLLPLDDPPSRFALAAFLLNGYGLSTDTDRALDCLTQAACGGHQIAQGYLYRMFVACQKDIPAGIPVLEYLKNQALCGSRTALQDLKRLDPEEAANTRQTVRFWYGGVGANWFCDSQWLHGLNIATFMSTGFSLDGLASTTAELHTVVVNTRGDGLLHASSALGAYKLVHKLLTTMKFEVNQRNKKGETALLCACRSGHPDIVKLLLDNGARAAIQSEDGESPLHWLLSFDEKVDVAALGIDLIERGGAQVDAFTTRRIAHSVFPASIDMDFQVEGTPLMWAVHDNSPRIVSFLLSKGADPHWQFRGNNISPMQWAAFYHRAECLRLMVDHLEKTANVPTTSQGTRDNRYVAFYGPLVRYAVSASDKFSMILRNGLSYIDQLKSTLALLQEKTERIRFNLGQNETLLHMAAKGAHDEACQSILESNWLASEINKPAGLAGRTPLLESVRWNRRTLFHLLIRHGADATVLSASPYDETGRPTWTALHHFADQAHDDDLALVDDLVAAGVPVDGDGETPFDIAVRRSAFRLADRLRAHGAALDAASLRSALLVAPHPLTALGHAVARNSRCGMPALRYLLAAGAGFVVEGKRGLTALHLVALVPEGFDYVAGGLLERRDFDWETNRIIAGELLQWFREPQMLDRPSGWEGKTALHFAAAYGNVEVVEKLVRAGASKQLRCNLGETAVDTARRTWSGKESITLLNRMLVWLQ